MFKFIKRFFERNKKPMFTTYEKKDNEAIRDKATDEADHDKTNNESIHGKVANETTHDKADNKSVHNNATNEVVSEKDTNETTHDNTTNEIAHEKVVNEADHNRSTDTYSAIREIIEKIKNDDTIEYKETGGEIKNFSTTLTSAKEGENRLIDMNPEVKRLIRKVKSKEKNITNEELNKIIEFFFTDIKEIKPGCYKINKAFSDNIDFEIKIVHIVFGKNDKIEDIILVLREATCGLNLYMIISIKNFHDMFKTIEHDFV